MDDTTIITRASRCLSIMSAASVRRVGYGLEVGRSVRTAGGAGAYCVATRTACLLRAQCSSPLVT